VLKLDEEEFLKEPLHDLEILKVLLNLGLKHQRQQQQQVLEL